MVPLSVRQETALRYWTTHDDKLGERAPNLLGSAAPALVDHDDGSRSLSRFCGRLCEQRSTGIASQPSTPAQVVAARKYRTRVITVCKRYNAEIKEIGQEARGSRAHEAQLARATNAVTASEARALMQIPRPPGFAQLERLYQGMTSAAKVADEATRLFSAGQLHRANAASLSASHELGALNGDFRRLGLSICAE